jgi:nitroreductase
MDGWGKGKEMSFEELVFKTRSYRRFHQATPVALDVLRELVDLARQTASGANLQPLKYVLVADAATNARVFPCTRWAGYLQDWPGPAEGERPAAYIVILGDTELHSEFNADLGIAAQTIMLAAAERGLGGCMIGSLDRDVLREVLAIADRYKILLVLALGQPAEKVILESVGPDGNIRYYRDADDVHHVPKRTLAEIIVAQFG